MTKYRDGLVSIIIPCFNAEKTIDRSIESVFDQDWPCIELIVIDDGSTDTSANHIVKWNNLFSKKGWTLKYIYQNNQGLGAAIKKGLEYVTGQYLTLLDADDRFLAQSISAKAQFLNAHDQYALVRSNGYIVTKDNRWLFTYDEKEKNGDFFDLLMRGKTYNWAGSYMLRTKKLAEFYCDKEFYPSRYGQNLQILIPVSYCNKCGYIDRALVEYIHERNSLSRENVKEDHFEKSMKNAKGYLDIRQHVIEEMPFEIEEKQYWTQVAEGIYYRRMLQIGIEINNKKMIHLSVRKLKDLKAFSDEDRVQYFNYQSKYVGLLYRMIRKIHSSM